jgi:hypothetical protein
MKLRVFNTWHGFFFFFFEGTLGMVICEKSVEMPKKNKKN